MAYFDEMPMLVALKKLINQGVALIPLNKDKEPYAAFKGKKKLGLVELIDAFRWAKMERGEDCERVGIRCGGEEGGGVVCIDVDSKYKEGFSERIYSDLQTLFPSAWEKFRIDKTPSGGLHIYYKVVGEGAWDGEGIRSCDLAHREATEDELALNPKRKNRCFVELKASDGSLCTSYPSIGYILLKGEEIGSIELEEHLEIISLLKSHNEVIREEKIRSNKSRDSIYIEGKTPFDCFNISDSAELLLEDLGWKRLKKYGGLQCFAKPGANHKRVGATFNPSKRTYAILTTGSEIETDCYKASTLLCKEKFGGDAFKCYSWLVNEGFGVLKPEIEKREIRKALRDGVELPKIVSKEGIEKFNDEKGKFDSKFPYGVFWEEDENGEFKIGIEMFLRVSSELGFRTHKENVVWIKDRRIKECDSRFYFDYMKFYMNTDDLEQLDSYEEFLQKSGKFCISRLELLDLSTVLRSTKTESYKFFSNCFLSITEEGELMCNYSELNQNIWEKDIKKREYNSIENVKGEYWKFIQNAIGWNSYVMKCIGFYAHDFRDEESYLIATTEKCEDPKDGGGSGKNVFWKMFAQTTTFKSTAASMVKKDNQLLQSWNGERVFVLADLPKGYDLVFFKDIITDGAVVRKLYKDEYNVDVCDMAKIGVSLNYSVDDQDPGIKRRLRVLEFTDYYTLNGGVKKVHGKMFPAEWNERDFLEFDNIMTSCIIEYLKGKCIIERNELSDTGWTKKFEQKHKHLYQFIGEYIDSWINLGKVSVKLFNDDYSRFRSDSNINKGFSSYSINKALEDYCSHYKIPFVHSYRKKNGELSDGIAWKENSVTVKGRMFGREAEKFIARMGIGIEVEAEVDDLPF